jgi:hypothetical protein
VRRQTREAHRRADLRPPGHPTYSSTPPLARVNSDARRRPRRRVATGLERGRRPAAGAHNSGATREEVGPPAGHRGDPEHATGAGPVRRGPAPARRPGGLRCRQGRRRSACPHARAARPACRRVAERGRPPGHGLIFTRTRTTRHYRPADSHPGTMPGEPATPAVSSTAGLDGPRSALGATATRTLRSPSQGWTRLVAGVPTQGRLTIPRSTRPRPPGGSRLRPGATACRNTPAAQSGRGRDSPPAARPRAAGPTRGHLDRGPQPSSGQRQPGSHRSPSREAGGLPAAAQCRPPAR